LILFNCIIIKIKKIKIKKYLYENKFKKVLVMQKFRKALKIGFISFDLSSLENGC